MRVADAGGAPARGKRAKRTTLMTVVVGAGLAMLAWSQVWFTYSITLGAQQLAGEVRGDSAAPAVMALALAALAVLAALALAGLGFRFVLGALLVLVGGTMVLQSFSAVGAPAPAIAPLITEATGLEGAQTIADAVAGGAVETSLWPWLGVVAGVVLAASGVLAIVTARSWPVSGRRFQATALETAEGEAVRPAPKRAATNDEAGKRVDQWDALSHGDDPTAAGDEPASR